MSDKPFALIVDDEWRLARNLVQFLQRRGFDAAAVTSVTDANALITERRPDIALIDLKLPDFNGQVLCRMLNERYPDTPLLVMSARVDDQEREALQAVGVRGFLTKPFALQQLAAELASVHGAAALPTPTRLEPATPPRKSASVAGRSPGSQSRPGPRVVLYSHDTMGLGHMRRNILIARTLAESRLKANVLLVSGAREIGKFELPPGIDCLVLPSYSKSISGSYHSRHLDMETRELVALRAHTINASISAFDPDVMVVDNVPRGAMNELDGVLSSLNARGRTHCVLGLRDILDSPETTRKEWAQRNNLSAIRWQYDEVWVYGDPRIYNICEAYDFGTEFSAKVRFSGYLDARKRAIPRSGDILSPEAEDQLPGPRPYHLCLVGGGQDGFALAEAFARAEQPRGTLGLIITGPFMQPDQIQSLHEILDGRNDLQILGFVQEPTRLLGNARRVVAMGGYNTVNEVLAFDRPTLIVPRVRPRQEQIIRALRLAELGHVDMLHPERLNPSAIANWLAKPDSDLPSPDRPINLDGLDRLVEFVDQIRAHQGPNHATA